MNVSLTKALRLFTQTDFLDGRKQPRVPLEISGKSDPCGNLRSFYRAVVKAARRIRRWPTVRRARGGVLRG